MKRKLGFLAALIAAAVFLIVPAYQAQAQSIYAVIHGTITDTTGAVIPGATVTALDTATGIHTTVQTNASGYYTFPQLQIGGPYTVTVTANGFQQFASHGLVLHANDNREIDAHLKVGTASQTVEVQAAAVQVETADTQLKQVVTSQQILNAPLLSRDASGLQKLQPGTVESSDRFGTFSSNGNQTQDNSYLLNGADINDGPLQDEGITINPDALAEEDFVTSTLNPDVARNSGEEINQVIKSGTNQFHGDAFWFYRDTFLNNGNYFSKTRPNYHQNLYGATLGGPVFKNKLFFFLAYQGFKNSIAATQLSPVFNPSQLAGNFSGDNNVANAANAAQGAPTTNMALGLTSNPIPFNIPTSTGTCVADPTAKKPETWADCFPNGNVQIAPGNWNPIVSKLLKQYMPAANETIGAGSYYNFNAGSSEVNDQGVIRLDYHISQKDSLWGSSVFQSSPSNAVLGFGGADLPGFGTTQAEHFKVFMAAWNHTFNSTTLNDLRAGYYRFNFAAVEPAHVVQPSSAGFDITSQNHSAGLPLMTVTGLGSILGFSFEGPQPRKDTNLDAADNFTKIVGNHSLKFGFHYEQFGVENPYSANNNGSYGFAGAGTYSSGDPILDFAMGIPDTYEQTSGGLIDTIAHEYYAYAQDSWRATQDLTLNYGVVWDVETPNSNHQFAGTGVTCWDASDTTSKVYPGGPPGLTYPADPGCNLAGGITTKWNHFGPRVGFAWSPSSGPAKIVGAPDSHSFALRGGFGVYWNRDAQEGQLQNLGDPPAILTSHGAADFGGSPALQNPFADVAGNGSEPNPFPYAIPTPGSQLNWASLAELDISEFPKSYTVPYAYNFNLNVQRALPSHMVLEVGYVGSIGRKLVRDYEGDRITQSGHAAYTACLTNPTCVASLPAVPGITSPANAHLFFPQYFTQPGIVPGTGNGAIPQLPNGLPWYLSVGEQATDGASNYNSLQVSLQKAPTHGLQFTLAYTYSHALDNGSGLESSGFNGLGVNTYPGYEYLSYGDSDFDARQRFVVSYNYMVPLPPSWNQHMWAREAIGGWHISGVTTLQTGFPVTMLDEGDYNSFYCDQFSYYSCPSNPNTSTFHIKTLNPRAAGNLWFDPSVFSPEAPGTFGNVKRNFFHGPGFNYTDMSLYKSFPMGGEHRSLEIRMDAYNLFNHANFAAPDSDLRDGPGYFGVITSVIGSSTADVNGEPTPGRDVQLSGKFYF